MTKKKAPPTAKATKKATRQPSRVVVLFGLDQEGIPRGGRFPDDDQLGLSQAAIAQGFRIAVASKAAHFQITGALPTCRLNSTGTTNVPKIKKEIFDQITSLVGGEIGPISPKHPKSPEEITPGHLVLAQESLEDGWFEAIVIKCDGDLTLRWRDYPSIPEFQRPITAVALLGSKSP
jgi:hypothetical protein